MKNKFSFIIGGVSVIALFILVSFKSGQDGKSIIVIRTLESENNMFASKVVVSDGKTTLKILELEAMRPKTIEANITTIASVLNEYSQQGYRLVSSNSGAGAFNVTNYVMER